jgi:hypothetical protein
MQVQSHSFLASALDGGQGGISRLGSFATGKGSPLPIWGGRVDAGVNVKGLEKWKILCLCRESRPIRPARSLVTTLTELSQLLLV